MLTVGDERVASSRHRALAFRPSLEAAGFSVGVRFPLRAPGPLRRLGRAVDLLRDVTAPARERVLFVQRKTFPPALAPRLARADRPIVFDMDDAIDLPPPSRALAPAARERYRANFLATVEVADLVLCGNRELAARLPHRRFELLPTAIDTARFAPEAIVPASAGLALGWVGHSDNLRYLEALGEPLRELARRHPGLSLIVVADRPPHLAGVDVEFRRWTLQDEVSCFRGISVGLMPLEDTPWTRGKCAFKAIQYMALGIPPVASPVGANRDVVHHGRTGFLPADDREWVEQIDRLLEDRELRLRIGDAARRAVVADYSLDVVAPRLIGILTALVGDATRAGRRLDPARPLP
jgi:glycosyltransferase involved in cell wall biosynthesis